jgi:hypothetical protein
LVPAGTSEANMKGLLFGWVCLTDAFFILYSLFTNLLPNK